MSGERLHDFSHLFEALRAGCPPHAGFAIGFDRLVAVMTGRESVKDVIAFPKSSKGEDMMVRSPARMTDAELARYHLQLVKPTPESKQIINPAPEEKADCIVIEPPFNA
jgi:aspartyl-tRNA synthetase